MGKKLHVFRIDVDGSEEAYAVDGTPADTVCVGLRSDLFPTKKFSLVVSGINRGDNAGYHIVYSGTVGAARQAAMDGLPALAFSLDDHSATTQEQYAAAAVYAVAMIKVRDMHRTNVWVNALYVFNNEF